MIKSYDLYLCDCQQANLMGINNEFVVGQGLDDLCCSYGNLYGLLDVKKEDIENIPNIIVSVFFDGEEVGSRMRQGAQSVFVPSVLDRITSCFATDRSEYVQMKEIGYSKSLVLSMDVGHANHPNQGGHIEKNSKIYMNQGLYTEQNSRCDLVFDNHVFVVVNEMGKKANVPFQVNVKKQEGGVGGSTIGPLIAHFSGMNVIDFGIAMLAMHSIREICGLKDVEYLRTFAKYAFEHFHEYSLEI